MISETSRGQSNLQMLVLRRNDCAEANEMNRGMISQVKFALGKWFDL